MINNLKILQKQNKLNKEEILAITSKEELIFTLRENMFKNAELNNLYTYFQELRELIIEKEGINIFEEHLSIKFFYLQTVYGVEEVILYALLELLGPVFLDYVLETEILNEDNFYNYYLTKYKEYKSDNQMTIFKLLSKLDIGDLKIAQEDLDEAMKELKKYAE